MEMLGDNRFRVFEKPVPQHFHLYYYSRETIGQMLHSEGFEVSSLKTYIPGHPVYLRNKKGKWVQESLYALGGLFGQGPSMEIMATTESAPR